ncbi:MAG: glycosyltransferase, partial [Anaerolineae bacterium]|nr:glycosyltransferase [Anaerolineae bacterium]
MNILHIIPYYAPAWSYGGVVRAATDMTRAQVEAGHSVTVLTSDTYNATERLIKLRETIDGVEVWRVRNLSNNLRAKLNLAQPWRMPATVKLVLRQHKFDIVHCHEVRTVE